MKNRPTLIRKIAVYAAYILLITTIQVTFPGVISLKGLHPDMMLALVVLCSYMFGFGDGIVVGALVGILRDYFAGPSITSVDGSVVASTGIGLLMMILAASFGSSFFTVRIERNFAFAVFAVAAATLIYKIFGHVIIFAWSSAVAGVEYNMTARQALMNSVLPQLLLNTACAVPLYAMLHFLGPYKKGINPVLIDEKSGGGSSLWLTM